MKKVQVLLIAIVVATMAFAQPEKGNIYLGGNLNIGFGGSKTEVGSTSTDGPKTFNFGISPKVGYFISDKLSVGLDLGYNMNSSKLEVDPTTTTTTSSMIGTGVFARYHIFPVEKFGFFFEGNVGASFGGNNTKTETSGTTNEYKKSLFGINAGISPGLAIYFSKKVAFEAQYGFLGFTSTTETDDNGAEDVKDTQGGFGLNVNPSSFKFGVSVLF
ncbi:MAG: outer membrane beta-barrel protein [Chitinophagales bacterium]